MTKYTQGYTYIKKAQMIETIKVIIACCIIALALFTTGFQAII